jgi:hypothetical protein
MKKIVRKSSESRGELLEQLRETALKLAAQSGENRLKIELSVSLKERTVFVSVHHLGLG